MIYCSTWSKRHNKRRVYYYILLYKTVCFIHFFLRTDSSVNYKCSYILLPKTKIGKENNIYSIIVFYCCFYSSSYYYFLLFSRVLELSEDQSEVVTPFCAFSPVCLDCGSERCCSRSFISSAQISASLFLGSRLFTLERERRPMPK